jgi:hypothetical protein
MAQYDFDLERVKAQQAAERAGNVDQQINRGREELRMNRPRPQPAPQPKAPSTASKVGQALKQTLTKPRAGVARTAMNLARPAAGMAARVLSLPVGLAATAGVYGGGKIGEAINNTKAGNENFYRPITDAASRMTGMADLNERLMSDDPEVSRAAVAEWKAKNNKGQTQQQQQQQPTSTTEPVPTAATDAPVEAGAAPTEDAPNSQEAAELAILSNQRPASAELNAKRPEVIPGSEYSYAGQYGDTDVLTRPDPNVNQPNSDGSAVPEFTDQYSAFGAKRPMTQDMAQRDAIEAAKAEQARADYERNTTMSDGRRAFGGSTMEKLRGLQMDEAAKGDPSGTVTRQLAEEGRTPEQRAAYEADPAGAYQVDATAQAANSKTQLDAFKYAQDAARNASTDARADRTETRRAGEAATKTAETALKSYELTAPDVHSAVMREAAMRYDNAQGQRPMSEIIAELFDSIEKDESGMPVIENGNIKLAQPGLQRPGQMDQLEPYL